jgi:hypothetical protein
LNWEATDELDAEARSYALKKPRGIDTYCRWWIDQSFFRFFFFAVLFCFFIRKGRELGSDSGKSWEQTGIPRPPPACSGFSGSRCEMVLPKKKGGERFCVYPLMSYFPSEGRFPTSFSICVKVLQIRRRSEIGPG